MEPRTNKHSFYDFDDANNEVVFHRHDMPTPWLNYLTNGEFFTFISQAGGNLSWYKSAEIWRIGRYGFYNLPTDKQGLFIYIKDLSTGKVWNPSIIPSDTPLDFFESRHGLGYSKYIAEKDGIRVELIAFVGKDNALIYKMNIKSNEDKKIQIFAAKEMGNMEYARESTWQCYTKQSNNILYNKDVDALVYDYFIDFQARPDETPFVFMTSTLQSSSFTGIRKHFLGAYRDLSNPEAIEVGKCPNTELRGGEGVFAFGYDVELVKDDVKEVAFTVGTVTKEENLNEEIKKYATPLIYNEEKFSELWGKSNNNYTALAFSEESPELISTAGIRVRSKSEMLIADCLTKNKIPFKYEFPIKTTNGITLHPDFICLNTKTHQQFLWEHFGLMDNSEYAVNMVQKDNLYRKNGFFQGKNLIYTFETKQQPITSREIETRSQRYL